MCEHTCIEKNCMRIQRLVVGSNIKLDKLAGTLNEAESAKENLMVEVKDLNCWIGETNNTITTSGKSKVSLNTC